MYKVIKFTIITVSVVFTTGVVVSAAPIIYVIVPRMLGYKED